MQQRLPASNPVRLPARPIRQPAAANRPPRPPKLRGQRAAAALAARGLFAAGEEQALYLAGGVLCALSTLLRGGVTARGFTGLRGGSCPWVKVRSVQMTEGEKNLALTCNSLTGAFTLSFALSQKEPLLKALDTYCKKQK